MPGLGDGPIDADIREKMKDIARLLDGVMNKDGEPKRWGFCLMMFPFEGFDGRCNYISNATREDVVVLFKEQLARFEGQPEMEGKA